MKEPLSHPSATNDPLLVKPLYLKKWRMLYACIAWFMFAVLWILLFAIHVYFNYQKTWDGTSQNSNAKTVQVPVYEGDYKKGVSFAGYGLYVGHQKVSVQSSGKKQYIVRWSVQEEQQRWALLNAKSETSPEQYAAELWFWGPKGGDKKPLEVQVIVPNGQGGRWDKNILYADMKGTASANMNAIFSVRFVDGKALPYDGMMPSCTGISLCVLELYVSYEMPMPWIDVILDGLLDVMVWGALVLVVWYLSYPMYLQALGVWRIWRKKTGRDLFS